MLRSASVFLLLLTSVGCYRSHERPSRVDAGADEDAAVDAGVDAGDRDAGVDAGSDAGPPCPECLPGPVVWGFVGGLFPSRVSSELSGCTSYLRTRSEPSGMVSLECNRQLACVDPEGVGTAELQRVLEDPEVLALFDAGDRVFAEGMAFPDLPSFGIEYRGARVVFALDCAFEACSSVPPALEALRRTLLALDEGLPAERCAALGGLVARP